VREVRVSKPITAEAVMLGNAGRIAGIIFFSGVAASVILYIRYRIIPWISGRGGRK
jgi:hypothetical protein